MHLRRKYTQRKPCALCASFPIERCVPAEPWDHTALSEVHRRQHRHALIPAHSRSIETESGFWQKPSWDQSTWESGQDSEPFTDTMYPPPPPAVITAPTGRFLLWTVGGDADKAMASATDRAAELGWWRTWWWVRREWAELYSQKTPKLLKRKPPFPCFLTALNSYSTATRNVDRTLDIGAAQLGKK